MIIWCTRTSKIVRKYELPNKVIDCIEWCPNIDYNMLAVTNEEQVRLVAPGLATKAVNERTRGMLELAKNTYTTEAAAVAKEKRHTEWEFKTEPKSQIVLSITHKNIVSRLSWHPKGDYLATMQHNIQSTAQVLIHSISKGSSMKPFSTTNGIIHCIAFHPTKPHFFASTQTTVFQYNLQK